MTEFFLVVGWNFPYRNPIAMRSCPIAFTGLSSALILLVESGERLVSIPALFGWVIRPIRCSTRCQRPTRLPDGWPVGRVSVRGGWSG